MEAEFSRTVSTDTLAKGPQDLAIEAAPSELAAVAQRLGLEALNSLWAEVDLVMEGPRKVWLRGILRARVAQVCVVSLETTTKEIEESFSVLYAAPAVASSDSEIVVGLGEDEAPEPLLDGAIDVGEAVTQQLILALDPFPRKPDAVVPAFVGNAERGSEPQPHGPHGPFGALAALKKDG